MEAPLLHFLLDFVKLLGIVTVALGRQAAWRPGAFHEMGHLVVLERFDPQLWLRIGVRRLNPVGWRVEPLCQGYNKSL